MRGRTAILLGSGALLLVVLIVMKGLLADQAPAAASPGALTPTAAPVSAEPAALGPGNRSARIAKPLPPARVTPPVEPPAEAEPAPPPPRLATGAPVDDEPRSTVPVANKPQLREAMNAIEPAVRACIEQHGREVTGSAVLTWSVVSKGGQSVVESTGVDYDETTFEQPALLECLQKTAEQMQFAPNPGALPVAARRRVAIEAGRLQSQQFLSFSRVY